MMFRSWDASLDTTAMPRQERERTIAWINRCRRLAKDYENLNRTAIAFIRLASIRLLLRRITRYRYPS